FSVPGQETEDSPFIQLAKRILTVTTNSASCERLFSVFGNKLTKLCNRLGTTTLSNLAELKMLIRDEHIRAGESQKRLKWKFGQDMPEPEPQAPPPAPPTPSDQPDGGSDIEEDEDAVPSVPEGEFALMIADMERMVQGDNDPEDEDGNEEVHNIISVKISDLFNFTKPWGVSELEVGCQNLNTEVELAEFIDKAGISDDSGLDTVTEAVLNGL
ncbi:hypothetical protein K438DRAFT_2071500, partial [Mycena galopus ATCC 62051]